MTKHAVYKAVNADVNTDVRGVRWNEILFSILILSVVFIPDYNH